mgnify:CR=1 FL=1|tara:strand:+ start:1002 stop:2009 length:1008 start_codon:yes stop_codon:yes gene_type:complete
MIKKNKFLITGGTGSFGKSMLTYLIKNNAKEIRILSRDEKKQENMRLGINDNRVKFILGDVRDSSSIEKAFDDVDYVFHAAALKQVPSCEFYPLEAIKTNIIGTDNVISCALNNRVKSLVLLSTDKSVYPVNAMGMTKALAEKLILSKLNNIENKQTKLCITRYGNVMGSRGSVIPLFIDQIKRKKNITVTDLSMTRFLMSLDESIELVIKAFKDGNTGDIFVKKAPSVTIKTLVNALLDIFNSNSKIKIIGTRHGEKLYETLVSREELTRAKESDSYFCIKADSRTINYDTYFIKGSKSISKSDDYNSHNTNQLSKEQTKKILMKMDFVKKELK